MAAPAVILAALVSLSGCSKIGDPLAAIGARVPPPNEFDVIASAPLQVPDGDSLPTPRVGAPSPLAPDPHAAAIRALLGSTDQQLVAANAPSAGERVLLSSANAAATTSDVRVQLEKDKIDDKANKPYEPPSLLELLGMDSKDPTDPDAIDPVAEAQRLQQTGVRAPSDPNAAAPVAEADKPAAVTPEYTTGRPQNKITYEGTGPKF
jgi:hypothetical protein